MLTTGLPGMGWLWTAKAEHHRCRHPLCTEGDVTSSTELEHECCAGERYPH